MLLSGENEDSVCRFFQQAASSLSKWFVVIKEWSPSVVFKERREWLNIMGVPTHAWGEDIFKNLAHLAGSYVGVDDSTRLKRRMDVGRVLISASSSEVVNRMVNIKINNKVFVVRMVEKPFSEELFFVKSNRKTCILEVSSSDTSTFGFEAFDSLELVPETKFSSSFLGKNGFVDFQDFKNSKFKNFEYTRGGVHHPLSLQDKGVLCSNQMSDKANQLSLSCEFGCLKACVCRLRRR